MTIQSVICSIFDHFLPKNADEERIFDRGIRVSGKKCKLCKEFIALKYISRKEIENTENKIPLDIV